MKVGIISINMYAKYLNLACPLHTFAFQQFLLKNGIESVILDYKPVYYDNFNLRNPYQYYAEKCKALQERKGETEKECVEIEKKLADLERKKGLYGEIVEEREIRYQKYQRFIKKYYIKTKTCYDSDLLEVMDPGFDCYICATDVIWKNQPNCGFDRGYFLASSSMENKWKISYAASRGVYFAGNEEEEKLFFHYLEDFDALSVREASLEQYIEDNTGWDVKLVLDPVLLHERDFYEKFAVKPEEEHYVFLYYVMEKAKDTISNAVKYARLHHMKIVEITDLPLKNGRLTEYTDVDHVFHYDVGIEEWVGYFLHADCVFTNSFHACCLSILFEKEFYVGSRHGDKVTNILKTFGLLDRKLNKKTDFAANPPAAIDYEKVREILAEKRKESSEFLLDAIHKAEEETRPQRDYDSYKKSLTYQIQYNTSIADPKITWNYLGKEGSVKKNPSGTYEFISNTVVRNDGLCKFQRNGFYLPNYKFRGWQIRFRIDNRWFYYLEDGSLKDRKSYQRIKDLPRCVFQDMDTLPYLPVNRISLMVAEAVWEENEKDSPLLPWWKTREEGAKGQGKELGVDVLKESEMGFEKEPGRESVEAPEAGLMEGQGKGSAEGPEARPGERPEEGPEPGLGKGMEAVAPESQEKASVMQLGKESGQGPEKETMQEPDRMPGDRGIKGFMKKILGR